MVSIIKMDRVDDFINNSPGSIIAYDAKEKQCYTLGAQSENNSASGSAIIPIVDYKKGRRSVIYASGMSGAGKSSFALSVISASTVLLQNLKAFKQRLIIVTREELDEDENYTSSFYNLPSIEKLAKAGALEVVNMTVTDLIAADVLNTFLPTCSGYITYILLDDMDSLTDDKEYYKQFEHLLLTRARKFRVHVFICNHRAVDAHNTKHILTELTNIWIPTTTKLSLNFRNMLDKHLDLQTVADIKLTKFIADNKKTTRFVYVSLDNPHATRYFVLNNKVLID